MKRILLSLLCLLTVGLAKAELEVTNENGVVTLTLNATGDLGKEFTLNQNYSLVPSAKIQAVLNATNIKIVTKNGAQMNFDDIRGLCGLDDEKDNFRNLSVLDMEEADIATGSNWGTKMKWIDPLKKFTFPKSVTEIPASIFESASVQKIEEVIIPDNLSRTVNIGQHAFFGCTQLKKVYLGGKIDNVGSMCFDGCTALTTVDFGFGSTNLNIGDQAFYGCTSLTKIVLPEGVKEIGHGAFASSAIKAIRLPNSLEYIRSMAFNTTDLKSIIIPENVKLIESQAFQNNYNLKDVYVLGENTKAQEQAFQPLVTYSYNYNGAGQGEVVDPRTAFTPKDQSKTVVTLFHYPEAAKDKYVNPVILSLGTQGNTIKYAQDSYGNKFPIVDDGKFNGDPTEYSGWHDFLISAEIRPEEIWKDTVRVRDKWYSLCLPFDMDQEQLQSAYGATVEVVDFSGAKVETKDNVKYLSLQFKTPVTATKAHHPYMIHPGIHSGDLTGIQNTIVGIERKQEDQASLDAESVTIAADGVDYKFIGNYTDGKQMPANTYFYYNGAGATNGTFAPGFYKRTQAGGKWGKYTAMVLASKDDGVKAKANTLFFVETLGTTTGISTVPVTVQGESKLNPAYMGKVLNLNGQVVRSGSSLEGLPKGVYIVNGKKYVIR